MNLSKKKFLSIFAIVIAVSLLSGFFIELQAQNTNTTQKTVYLTTGAASQDTLNVVARHANGQIFLNYTGHNLLTSQGSSYLIGAMSNTTNDGATTKAVYMTCSTNATAPAVTWTSYGANMEQGATQGLGRTAALTPTYGTCTTASGLSTYFTVSTVWTATATVTAVVVLGLNYKATANSTDLIAAAAITSVTLASSDTLTPLWNVTIPCG